jgi:hypothetical protein
MVCDEVQFYSREQCDQLARVVDDMEVDVYAFGLITDFRGQLFDGTKRMLEIADEREPLHVEARCWCGARATHNARVVNDFVVYEGETVVVGDTAGPGVQKMFGDVVRYELLCRRHYNLGELGDGLLTRHDDDDRASGLVVGFEAEPGSRRPPSRCRPTERGPPAVADRVVVPEEHGDDADHARAPRHERQPGDHPDEPAELHHHRRDERADEQGPGHDRDHPRHEDGDVLRERRRTRSARSAAPTRRPRSCLAGSPRPTDLDHEVREVGEREHPAGEDGGLRPSDPIVLVHRRAFYHAESRAVSPDAVNDIVRDIVRDTVGDRLAVTR